MIRWLASILSNRTFGVARSPEWPRVRAAFLRVYPECEVCGAKSGLDVHHVIPVHCQGGKKLELDSANLITVCTRCHLLIAHYAEWSSWNNRVRRDAKNWRKRIEERP